MPDSVIAASSSKLPETAFSGYAMVCADVVFGEDGFRSFGEVPGGHDGAYISVTRTSVSATIATDAAGYARLYLYVDGERWAVGTSLIELAEWVKAAHWPLHRDEAQLASFLLMNTIGNQLLSERTAFTEIRLVPAGSALVISAGRRRQLRVVGPEPLPAWASYGGLLRQGLWEVASRARTLLECDVPLVADVSGGRDFRVALAALLAGNSSGRPIGELVRFRADSTRPGVQETVDVLGDEYGLATGRRAAVRRASIEPSHGYADWRRNELGVYGPIYPYRTFTPEMTVSGAGGEAHRRVYKSPSMEAVLMQAVPKGMEKRTAQVLSASMNEALTVRDVGSSDARLLHFSAFRERFHGGRTALRQPVFMPLASASLRRASRLRDPGGELGSQMSVDLIRNLARDLLQFPLEPESKPFPNRQVMSATTVSLKRVTTGKVHGTLGAPPTTDAPIGALAPFLAGFEEAAARVRSAAVLPHDVVEAARTVIVEAAARDRFSHASDAQVVSTVIFAGEVLRLT